MMEIWSVIGGLGVVFTSLQLVPQVIKSLRTRQVRDVSLGLSIVVGLSGVCWLAYGIHLGDAPLVTANGMNVIGALTLFVLKMRERVTPEEVRATRPAVPRVDKP